MRKFGRENVTILKVNKGEHLEVSGNLYEYIQYYGGLHELYLLDSEKRFCIVGMKDEVLRHGLTSSHKGLMRLKLTSSFHKVERDDGLPMYLYILWWILATIALVCIILRSIEHNH